MKKMILHIGTHKTATTSIQKALEKSRKTLARNGVWYAKTNRAPFAHHAKHNSFTTALTAGDAAFWAEKATVLKEFKKSKCETLVLSAEGLSARRFSDLGRVAEFKDDFDITVICYLRRQDYFVESLWNQFCGSRALQYPIATFMNLEFIKRRLQYTALLDFWAGFCTVKAVSFEAAKEMGVTDQFAALAGFALPAPAKHSNVSPSMNYAVTLSILNRFEHPYNYKKLLKAFKGDVQKYSLGARNRQELLAFVAVDNERLAEKYHVRFSTEMPDEGPEALTAPDPDALAKALSYLTR